MASTTDALGILDDLIGDDAEIRQMIAEEAANLHIAQLLYDARKAAGLTQKELAQRIDTSQSVVARLEDADYKGHSLSMLRRIADTLDLTVDISLKPKQKSGYCPAFVDPTALPTIKFITQRPKFNAEAYGPKASATRQRLKQPSSPKQVQSR
jgi:transcriptional regulator with XRE-family HTH domain